MSERTGIRIAFSHRRIPASMKPELSLALYRIVQEALHNVVRHSEASDAEVSVICDEDHVLLTVADSGIGFNPKSGPSTGLGVVSMQARAAALQGQLTIDASPRKGTRIVVRIPNRA
jgi:signal transduction histidine kinase